MLSAERPAGELERDRELVYEPLREGRCYVAVDSLAPARGFRFWAEGPGGELPMGAEAAAGGWTLHARVPREAGVRLLRDGHELTAVGGAELSKRVEEPGVNLIRSYAYSGPLEDVKLKRP